MSIPDPFIFRVETSPRRLTAEDGISGTVTSMWGKDDTGVAYNTAQVAAASTLVTGRPEIPELLSAKPA